MVHIRTQAELERMSKMSLRRYIKSLNKSKMPGCEREADRIKAVLDKNGGDYK